MNPSQEQVEDSLYPISVLVEELKNEDVLQRLNAVRRVSTIALALGPAKAREELVPFLDESIDNEDEVLVALAEELGRFVEYVGGPPFAHILLAPLENLAAVEETVVREKAVESVCLVSASLSQQQVEDCLLPVIKRLSAGEWFTNRTSATGIYAAAYEKASPAVQEELRRLYSQLCHDETPMVRRAAATNLAQFIKKVSKEHIFSEMIQLLKLMLQDDQDSVRVLAVEAVTTLTELLTEEENRTHTLEMLHNVAADKSWRVRQAMAESFVRLCKAVGREISREELAVDFLHLLKDSEAEVRTAVAGQLPGFAALMDETTITQKLMPCVKDLVTDTSQNVRSALAVNLAGLAPVMGKASTSELLLPLLLQLLKDEFPEVRLNIIANLQAVNEAIGTSLLSQSLFPAIIELVEDKQWRVRLAIIEYIPLLGSQLGVAFFDEKLGNLCMTWLGDCVFSVREAATINLRKLTEIFGVEWAKSMIFPKVLPMATNTNYLYRMTTILALTSLIPAVNLEIIRDHIIPAVTSMVADPIPNIRFNVAKSFEILIPVLQKIPEGAALLDQIVKPSLLKLSEDSDNDVRFYARRASQKGERISL